MSADRPVPAQHPGLILAAMTLANAMLLVDQIAVPLTLAEIMRTHEVGRRKAQGCLTQAW
jgi:hypothetical protein